MRSLGLWQVRLAQLALGLAGVVGVFFLGQVLVTHEACYGVVASTKNPCESLTAQSFTRLLVVVAIMVVLFAGVWLSARAYQTTPIPENRPTFLMSMIALTLLLVGITLSAFGGAGLYYLPSTLLAVVATGLGLADAWQRRGSPADAPAEGSPADGE